jgi:hypothetical protein
MHILTYFLLVGTLHHGASAHFQQFPTDHQVPIVKIVRKVSLIDQRRGQGRQRNEPARGLLTSLVRARPNCLYEPSRGSVFCSDLIKKSTPLCRKHIYTSYLQ